MRESAVPISEQEISSPLEIRLAKVQQRIDSLFGQGILETEAATSVLRRNARNFGGDLRGRDLGSLVVDFLKPHVDRLVVCNPRKNALLKDGNKSDRIDARKLAELLRGNQLKPVYHAEACGCCGNYPGVI